MPQHGTGPKCVLGCLNKVYNRSPPHAPASKSPLPFEREPATSANCKPLKGALSHIAICNSAEITKRMIDTFRILLHFEDDDSAFLEFFNHYEVPLEGAEFMWSQYVAYYKDNDIAPCHALAAGLRSLANAPNWESFLRRLLRHGVDLHVPLTGTINADLDHHKEVYP